MPPYLNISLEIASALLEKEDEKDQINWPVVTIYNPKLAFSINIQNRGKVKEVFESTLTTLLVYDQPIKDSGYYRIQTGKETQIRLIESATTTSNVVFTDELIANEHYLEINFDESEIRVNRLDPKIFKDTQTQLSIERTKARVAKDRHTWTSLHYLSYIILKDPLTEQQQATLRDLLKLIPTHAVSCGKCRKHYYTYLDEYPISQDEIVSTQEKFARFLQDYHNDVNRTLRKPEYTYEESLEYYRENQLKIKNELEEYDKNKKTIDYYYELGNMEAFWRGT